MKPIKELSKSARNIISEEGAFLIKEASTFQKHLQESHNNKKGDHKEYDGFTTKTSFKDIVTYLDVEVENRLKDKLSNILPGSDFLAEETDKAKKNSADKLWIIDPIDGTTNFLHNFSFYCISVALQLEGIITLGFVYSPSLDEFYQAEKGKGSFLNNQHIRVSEINDLKKSLLATGFAYNFSETDHNNLNYFKYFQANTQGIRRLGSAALDICNVAKGTFDGFWELFLNPWDVAAGILITEEAGGLVSNFDEQPYTFEDNFIIVSNARIHSQMMKGLQECRK